MLKYMKNKYNFQHNKIVKRKFFFFNLKMTLYNNYFSPRVVLFIINVNNIFYGQIIFIKLNYNSFNFNFVIS